MGRSRRRAGGGVSGEAAAVEAVARRRERRRGRHREKRIYEPCLTRKEFQKEFHTRKGEDTRRGRTSSEAHRVGDSYHRPATHVSLLAASVSVPVVVRDCW